MKFNYFLFVIIGLIVGIKLADWVNSESLKTNTVSGYHCQPIVKVKTLEEAKAIIEAHQKRIGSIK